MPRSKKSSSDSTIRLIMGIIVVVAILYIGLTGGEIPEALKPFLEEFGWSDDSSSEVVEETAYSSDWYSLYFTEPLNTTDTSRHVGSKLEAGLIQAIDNAQVTIDGALFELNMETITNALIRAHERGVVIRLVLDDDHAVFDDTSTVPMLEDAGIAFRDDDRSALMHNKFLIIDGTYVWTGSTNFTHNDIYNNNNHAILIRSQRLVENYQVDFDDMYLNGNFTRRGNTATPNPQINLNGTLIETYFAPDDGDEIEARINDLVRNADESVYVMAFSFTLDSLGDSLINRHENGVEVQAIFEVRGSEQGQMPRLVCAGIPSKTDGNPQTFHHKVFVIDRTIVIFGSFNFSVSARDSNSENMLIVHNAELAEQFIAEFDRRYNDSNAELKTRSDFGC